MEVPSGPLAREKSAQVARGDPARVIHVPDEGRNSRQSGSSSEAIRGELARVVLHVPIVEEFGRRLVIHPARPARAGGRCQRRDRDQQVLGIQTLLEGEMLKLVLRGRLVSLHGERRRERHAVLAVQIEA